MSLGTPFCAVGLIPWADVVEIQFNKPSFKYKAGQWLFLQVPSISGYQWHPFTITSCPYDPYVSVHVRQVGDFTRALGDAVGAGSAQSKLYDGVDPNGMYEVALQNGQQMPDLRIDGPYGAPAEDVFNNEIAVLIGTGIGVTPWAAILKNIWHQRNSPNPPSRLRRVEFIWVCKDTGSFEWFQTLLSSLEAQSAEAAKVPGSNGIEFLKIHTYLTQKLDIDTTQNIVINSVGADVDPLTELKARTNFGRPNFHRMFETMHNGILDRTYINGLEGSMQTTVGVYFCGPSAAGMLQPSRFWAKRTTANLAFQHAISRRLLIRLQAAKCGSASGRNTSRCTYPTFRVWAIFTFFLTARLGTGPYGPDGHCAGAGTEREKPGIMDYGLNMHRVCIRFGATRGDHGGWRQRWGVSWLAPRGTAGAESTASISYNFRIPHNQIFYGFFDRTFPMPYRRVESSKARNEPVAR